MKYILICCLFLLTFIWWQRYSILKLKNENQLLLQQNLQLSQNQEKFNKKLENFNEKQKQASRQIAKLKDKAQRQDDDCYNRSISSAYIELVRNNSVSNN